MAELNLEQHDPEEYEGKTLRWGGCDYRIGKYLGSGGSKIVHTLINEESGLHHHVAKVWRDIRAAREFEERGVLRGISSMFGDGLAYATELFGYGGCIEMMVYIGPYEASRSAAMAEADNASKNSDYAKARSLYEQVLEANPRHTVALNNYAASLAFEGNIGAAMSVAVQTLDIEPNYPPYYHLLFKLALSGGFLQVGKRKFRDLTSRFFPSKTDYGLGVDLYLQSGAPESARALHDECASHWNGHIDSDSDSRIDADLLAKRQAMAELGKAETTGRGAADDAARRQEAVALLRKALDHYDREPLIHINLGLQLLRDGQFSAARKHLLSVAYAVEPTLYEFCVGNAALAATKEGAIEEALHLFRALPDFDDLGAVDMPSLGVWVTKGIAFSEAAQSASDIVSSAIARLHKIGQSVPSDLEAIADRYREASAIIDVPVIQPYSTETARDAQ